MSLSLCVCVLDYSENITTAAAASCFGKEETDILLHLLEDYLGMGTDTHTH